MKRGLAVAIFAALAAHPAAQQPASTSPLDQPVHNFQMPRQLPPCGLETALARVAKETGVRAGMERTAECEGRKASAFPPAFQPLDLANAVVLDGVPVKEVLGRLAALAPDYDWAIMEGVVVFRPSAAWSDANNPLAARVPAIRFSEAPAGRVVAAILNLPMPAGPRQILSLDFPGGTVLEALNALVRSQAATWYASSNGQRLFVGMMLHPDNGGFGGSAPIPGLFARRP